jgi:hypothetical protein
MSRYRKYEISRLNKMISPYQGHSWSVSVRPEKERMQRAQSRKRRQIRKQETPMQPMQMWAWVVFVVFLIGLAAYRLG